MRKVDPNWIESFDVAGIVRAEIFSDLFLITMAKTK